MNMNFALGLMLLPLALIASAAEAQSDGRLRGTGGVSSISGAGGGGLIPWATLTGYATHPASSGSVFATHASVDDFTLDVAGAAINFRDRAEASFARQNFDIKANGARISQDVVGLKWRLAGDVLYDQLPQVVAGVEHHALRDPATARAVGARSTAGTDLYVGAARAWIAGVAGRTTLLNVNLRHSSANQYGLLGHGGDDMDARWQLEAAVAVFLTRSWVVGAEYRQKPDNLRALKEHDAHDVFIAWFPDKRVSLTAAWVNLGDIAGAPDQSGFYLSLQGAF
jgi:Protein of unknown function (DUF3034)